MSHVPWIGGSSQDEERARLDITPGFRLNHNQGALEHGCLGTVVELVRHGFRALGGSAVSTNDQCGVLTTRLGAYYGNRLQLYARAYPFGSVILETVVRVGYSGQRSSTPYGTAEQ